MSAPYWGQLPAPKVTRGSSLRRGDDQTAKGNHDLSIETDMAGGRSPGPSKSQPQQNRYSSQTDKTEAPTVSTQSPFASPIASEFRGDGLAPRPSSFQASASDTAYNRDYLEKRRRRETRNREQYETPSPIAPPAAPDVPRAPPPVSYRAPYSNGTSSNHQAPARSRSTRRSEGPVSPSKGPPEEYYHNQSREEYSAGDEEHFRAKRIERNNGKVPVRYSVHHRAGVERSDTNNSQPRKNTLSEAEAQRHREWAPDRSPLQRLELTLDSITKKEKRTRVEEAELLAREVKAGQVGERSTQNSVRFRNRPVAKAREPGTQPESQSLPEAVLARSLSKNQKDQVQGSGTFEKTRPSDIAVSPTTATGKGFEYQSQPDQNQEPAKSANLTPQRGPSFRERSKIPVAVAGSLAAAGVARSGSNKLRKEPPGYNKQVEAEKQNSRVNTTRKASVGSRQLDNDVASPSRDTAFRSHPQVGKDKELPKLPAEALEEMNHTLKPVRQGTLTKAQRVRGQNASTESPKSRQQPGIQTELVTVNGNQYAVQPSIEGRDVQQNVPQQPSSSSHYHLHNVLNPFRHPAAAKNSGVYVPVNRLDEWKKGGTALLSGPLLDLDISTDQEEQEEIEKDKTWWEAGNTGRRRRGYTSTQRKAEAYDGEYDDNNGMYLQTPAQTPNHENGRGRCAPGRQCGEIVGSMRSLHYIGSFRKTKNTLSLMTTAGSWSTQYSNMERHSLTCPTRAIRVRPDIAPTRFKPPLFLKCGPLLRYCGLRTEKAKSRSGRNAVLPDREIWRGSIMIVTQDNHSSYELAPTLRLFLQPMDLLPPPPAQVDGEIDELAPEYVDPIAGLPKIGRDGRTLYIRPIDYLDEAKDVSREESDEGLFESTRSPLDGAADRKCSKPHYDGERAGKYKEVRGFRLHVEQGMTFWRFNIEVELREKHQRIAYRINRGPATPFWVPARGEAMNIMFHSCNGFSRGVDPDQFCGPDPMWRDVLNTHQTQPFHVMLGGGDQIYNDLVMDEAPLYKEWSDIKDAHHKESLPFTAEMQQELESFYLNRYCMWFSQGLFGLAASQIPMINIFDDHDIIDGFGSYPDEYMRSPIFSGLGAVAFKYYMLFQHQSSIDEGEETEPSWILGAQPGPYIKELSRSVFTNLGRSVAFLGLDCRTERMNDEIVSAETYHKVFDRLSNDIVKGDTKHLIVLVGIPVAYPRMVWLENILTSRAMEPVKALGRTGLLGKSFINHMDGGVEILDDLDDHWTAKHHKDERNWFIQELQDLAAEKSVRVTILGGDVHLGAIGQFYSNPKLGIAKDHDFRYMPNIISSAIVNTPPPNTLADILNKRNKIHHLDAETDEDMIPIFTHDVNGKPRNNKRLLNRRNWCSIRQYNPELSPPATPQTYEPSSPPPKRGLLRRLSSSRGPSYRPDAAPPLSSASFFARQGSYDAPPLSNPGFFARRGSVSRRGSTDSQRPGVLTRTLSLTRKDFLPSGLFRRSSKRKSDSGGINGYGDSDSEEDPELQYEDEHQNGASGLRGGSGGNEENDGYFPAMPPVTGRAVDHAVDQAATSVAGASPQAGPLRSQFHRTPTDWSGKQRRKGLNQEINLEGGLDICLNMEVSPRDPAGITMPYRLLVPALWYDESQDHLIDTKRSRRGFLRWGNLRKENKKENESEMIDE